MLILNILSGFDFYVTASFNVAWSDNLEFAQFSLDKHISLICITLIMDDGCICNLGYFLFEPVVHNWFIEGCDMCCPVCQKVHIKYPLMLIGKSSLCGDSGFPLRKEICHNDHMFDVQ